MDRSADAWHQHTIDCWLYSIGNALVEGMSDPHAVFTQSEFFEKLKKAFKNEKFIDETFNLVRGVTFCHCVDEASSQIEAARATAWPARSQSAPPFPFVLQNPNLRDSYADTQYSQNAPIIKVLL